MKVIGGQTEFGPLRRVLLKSPAAAFPGQPLLDTQWKELGYHKRPALQRATEEFEAFRGLLEQLGATVQTFPASTGTGLDSLYVRDASVVTDDGMILCRMGKDARQGEPGAQEAGFLDMDIPILGRIGGKGRLEGGDVLWLDEETLAVGRGYRTNDEGIRQLRGFMDTRIESILTVPLPHWKGPSDVFHLMSVVSPLDRDLALVYSPLLPVPFREELIRRGVSLVEVHPEEFPTMGCNVLAVAPRVCVALDGNPHTRRRLEASGVEVHTYRGEEISMPGDGGPTCLTRPTRRGS